MYGSLVNHVGTGVWLSQPGLKKKTFIVRASGDSRISGCLQTSKPLATCVASIVVLKKVRDPRTDMETVGGGALKANVRNATVDAFDLSLDAFDLSRSQKFPR